MELLNFCICLKYTSGEGNFAVWAAIFRADLKRGSVVFLTHFGTLLPEHTVS